MATVEDVPSDEATPLPLTAVPSASIEENPYIDEDDYGETDVPVLDTAEVVLPGETTTRDVLNRTIKCNLSNALSTRVRITIRSSPWTTTVPRPTTVISEEEEEAGPSEPKGRKGVQKRVIGKGKEEAGPSEPKGRKGMQKRVIGKGKEGAGPSEPKGRKRVTGKGKGRGKRGR